MVYKLLFCMKIIFRSSKLLHSSVDALISVHSVWYSKNDVWFRSLTPLSSHMRASCENERKHFAVQYTAKGHGNANLSINIVSFGHSAKRVISNSIENNRNITKGILIAILITLSSIHMGSRHRIMFAVCNLHAWSIVA